MNDTREALAEYAHVAWAGWMQYMFEKGGFATFDVNGKTERVYIMPAWAVERWERQANTPYAELSEAEKESDRAEADRMLAIVGASTNGLSLAEIVAQLKLCGYECEAGKLEGNVAFIALERLETA